MLIQLERKGGAHGASSYHILPCAPCSGKPTVCTCLFHSLEEPGEVEITASFTDSATEAHGGVTSNPSPIAGESRAGI